MGDELMEPQHPAERIINALEMERDKSFRFRVRQGRYTDALVAVREILDREYDAILQDRRRLEWLVENGATVGRLRSGGFFVDWETDSRGRRWWDSGSGFREAIDEAMKAEDS